MPSIRRLRPWTGADILDIGCGTGFHLPRFAREAAHVVGVEPHAELVAVGAAAYRVDAERRGSARLRTGASGG